MTKTPAALPDTIEELRALVVLQQEKQTHHEVELSERNDEITQLREYIRLLKSQRFGSSSERSPSSQMGLFNEAESIHDEDEGAGQADGDASPIEVPAHTRRKRGGRKPLPAFLPREEILHDLSEEEKICCNDAGHRLTQIGIDRLEQLVFVPASAKVLVHLRPKYACSSCKDGVKAAPPPISPIPKSFATPSLLAQIVTSKYVDALPLYRQAKIYERMGVDLKRATMASWVIKMGELVVPLLGIMLKEIRGGDYAQMDETPFQVLKEKGKLATSSSYLWALRGGEAERPLLYYEYAPTRGAEVAKGLLEGFKGYLQTDGYKGYDGFDDENSGVVHVGCFAHARRKFDEALRGQGKKAKVGKKASLARQGLGRISELYKIERGIASASREERTTLRAEKLAPKIEALRKWTLASVDRVSPESLTGKAMGYLDKQWPKLERVLKDEKIPLDTNAVERAIRPFVIGRRNWMFADTPGGATASARLYSLVETAKANGIEPWAYLNHVFEKLPAAVGPEEIEALLPWRVEIKELVARVATD
ncbi:MAG: IS66 family transposase [Planctomycetota bacterium]|jgi:transposase|nr:IS66 family transposase [Planctomycetota bacterium]